MPVLDPIVATSSGESTDALLTMPASSEGDRLILWVSFAGGTDVAPTPPAGWSLSDRQDYLTVMGMTAYQKAAIAAEPANYTVGLGSVRKWTGGIAAYPGAGEITVQVGRADQYSRREFATEPITSASDNNRIVAIAAQGSPVREWTPPTGWALRGSQQTGTSVRAPDISSALLDIPQSVAGPVAAVDIEAAVGTSLTFIGRRTNGINTDFEQSVVLQQQWLALGFTDIRNEAHGRSRADIAADAESTDVTVILGEVSSNRLENDIDNLDAAIVCAESGNWDDVLMAPVLAAPDDEPTSGDVDITDASHPLAGGNPAGITPVSDPIFQRSHSGLVADTKTVAIHSASGKPIIFYVEKGDTNVLGGTFPARISGIGIHENAVNWTTEGAAIARAAIDWTVRYGPSPQLITMLAVPEASSADHSIVAQDATTPSPEFSRPTASQVHVLSASSVTLDAPEIAAAVAVQSLEITASSVSATAPELSAPAASQLFSVSASSPAVPAPVLSDPSATQAHILAASSATAPAPALLSPSADQDVSVSGISVTTLGPELERPVASQIFVLTGADITTAAPELNTPTVVAEGSIAGEDVLASAPILSRPFASQVHTINTSPVNAAQPELTRPSVEQLFSVLGVSVAASAPELGGPSVNQLLAIADISVAAEAPELSAPTASQIHEIQGLSVAAPNPVLNAPEIIPTGVLSGEDPLIPAPALGRPLVSQAHNLDVPSVIALPPVLSAPTASLSSVSISLGSPFSIQTTLTRPTAAQLLQIQGSDVTAGAPELLSPTATVISAISGLSVTADAPRLSAPVASQVFEVSAIGPTAPSPVFERPTVLATGAIAAISPTAPSPVLSAPAASQVFEISANSVTASTPELAAPTASLILTLNAQPVSADPPRLNMPTASQLFNVVAGDPPVPAPVFSRPVASQIFTVQGLDSTIPAPELSGPEVGQTLVVNGFSVTAEHPEIGTPTASVVHEILGFDVIALPPILGRAIAEDATIPFNLVGQSVFAQNPIFNRPVASQAENFIPPIVLIQTGVGYATNVGITIDSRYSVEASLTTEAIQSLVSSQ